VVSNHIISVAIFATVVVIKAFLWPDLSEFERYEMYLSLEIHFEQLTVATFKYLVATCGEWQEG